VCYTFLDIRLGKFEIIAETIFNVTQVAGISTKYHRFTSHVSSRWSSAAAVTILHQFSVSACVLLLLSLRWPFCNYVTVEIFWGRNDKTLLTSYTYLLGVASPNCVWCYKKLGQCLPNFKPLKVSLSHSACKLMIMYRIIDKNNTPVTLTPLSESRSPPTMVLAVVILYMINWSYNYHIAGCSSKVFYAPHFPNVFTGCTYLQTFHFHTHRIMIF